MLMLSFTDAMEAAILDRKASVITQYDLFRVGASLLQAGQWRDRPIKRGPKEWSTPQLKRLVRRLVDARVLSPDQDFRGGVWRVVQAVEGGSAEDVICLVDPFCYVSHLSAMQRYGLTDRSPEALHLTTPARAQWMALRRARVAEDLPDAVRDGEALLIPHGIEGEVRRRDVILHRTKYPTASMPIRGGHARISTIGGTFADMLSDPLLCGGMRHVVEVWSRNALQWREDIIPAIEVATADIVKVRAGYLFSEQLGVTDPRIDAWRAFAQRGGSRKLDPEGEYAPVFSEDWMISLNV